ncbi:polysaccharide deacetylase family protein [Bradyrhizobium daqingense]|uniref:Chitooligosaccharide deacetylase n=1 Tax=Bradyrhizobium daqingense TaxID=993502 RepID=A0A562KXS9_9BRAD|nr:polysaccharide deacetylase family protein [Bradyrhizobium daqingense]TWI00195.1 peptidoglycan/xylan/chitin deacetylase (PgdA/CDA1 family) [Bradyrhizobium daqingense]UFS90341.1 polysaccharide deacetylase family protein [Bradyrhizobium daqingense]
MLSALQGRVSNRLARHFRAAPHRMPARAPMVSFTFDDAPDSAAGEGAELLEKHGGRGTFYLSGSLIDRPSDHWHGLSNDAIVRLHRSGHEIACHTFSHRCAVDLGAAAMAREIARNQNYFRSIDSSITLENFAYPYGLASVWRKPQLARAYRSARGILPGVNRDVIDLQFLRASPLIDCEIDAAGIDRYFDDAVESGGWLIFYGHDVADRPSPYGCTPHLMRHALEAAEQRGMPIVTVADALRRIGA